MRNPEMEALKLKRRFQAISGRRFPKRRRPVERSQENAKLIVCGLVVAVVGLYVAHAWFWNSNLWPRNQAILEGRYLPDCAAARQIGIVPLYSGYPGYREGLDADHDGIACEPHW